MDKQKQIEEMANDIAKCCPDLVYNGCGTENCITCLAVYLLNKWQPKIPENAVVVMGDELRLYNANIERDREKLKSIRKETAEKFAERLKELLEEREYKAGFSAHMMWTTTAKKCVDEICKELTEVNK